MDVKFLQDQLNELYEAAPSVESHRLAQVLSCASTLVTQESATIGLPDFPLDNLSKLASILEVVSTVVRLLCFGSDRLTFFLQFAKNCIVLKFCRILIGWNLTLDIP